MSTAIQVRPLLTSYLARISLSDTTLRSYLKVEGAVAPIGLEPKARERAINFGPAPGGGCLRIRAKMELGPRRGDNAVKTTRNPWGPGVEYDPDFGRCGGWNVQ